MFAVTTGAWRGTGPRPTVKGAIKHGEGQALALRLMETVVYFRITIFQCRLLWHEAGEELF